MSGTKQRKRANIETLTTERQYLDQALQAKGGMRLTFDTKPDAYAFRMRCYLLRKFDRHNNAEIYPPDDPLHNASAYDSLTICVKLDGKEHCVIINNNKIEPKHAAQF